MENLIKVENYKIYIINIYHTLALCISDCVINQNSCKVSRSQSRKVKHVRNY